MMIGKCRTFTYIETRTSRHVIQRIFKEKDWNRKYFNILRF